MNRLFDLIQELALTTSQAQGECLALIESDLIHFVSEVFMIHRHVFSESSMEVLKNLTPLVEEELSEFSLSLYKERLWHLLEIISGISIDLFSAHRMLLSGSIFS